MYQLGPAPSQAEYDAAMQTKATKVSGAINGNFAGLDSNGNLTDSGHKPSDYSHVSIEDNNGGVVTMTIG